MTMLTIIVSVETVLLVLLGLLVVGLLRSHAEILRRLDAAPVAPSPHAAAAVPGAPASTDLPEPPTEGLDQPEDVAGTTLEGEPVKVAVVGTAGPTLLAFLSTGCLGCGPFWDAFRSGAGAEAVGARVVIVTKDASHESSSRLCELAPPEVALVQSSAAWDHYRIAGSPYFVLVDGPSGRVRGEGTAREWLQVVSLLRDAVADEELAAGPSRSAPMPGGREATGAGTAGLDGAARLARADAELAASGIVAGHPSLYAADMEADDGRS